LISSIFSFSFLIYSSNYFLLSNLYFSLIGLICSYRSSYSVVNLNRSVWSYFNSNAVFYAPISIAISNSSKNYSLFYYLAFFCLSKALLEFMWELEKCSFLYFQKPLWMTYLRMSWLSYVDMLTFTRVFIFDFCFFIILSIGSCNSSPIFSVREIHLSGPTHSSATLLIFLFWVGPSPIVSYW
jgi:hypothetical protein